VVVTLAEFALSAFNSLVRAETLVAFPDPDLAAQGELLQRGVTNAGMSLAPVGFAAVVDDSPVTDISQLKGKRMCAARVSAARP